MSLIWITATYHCDRCGAQFSVDIDPDERSAVRLVDAASTAVAAGGDCPLVCPTSRDGDDHLCAACTAAGPAANPPEE